MSTAGDMTTEQVAALTPDGSESSEWYYYFGGGYEALVNSIGTVKFEVSDNGYQGDTYVLLRDEIGRYGVLIFGWGSCSGCDALEGCSTIEAVTDLRNQLAASVEWQDTVADLREWTAKQQWPTFFYSWHEEGRTFIDKLHEFVGLPVIDWSERED